MADAALPVEWRFLREWFLALKNHVRVQDLNPHACPPARVQLGRDGDELWIEIVSEGGAAARDSTARCRLLHEALLVTSIVAVADYDVWLRALVAVSELVVPPAVDLSESPRRLQPRYQYLLSTAATSHWTDVKELLAKQDHSERFLDHYDKALALAAARGVDVVAMEPFAMRVVNWPASVPIPEQVATIHTMTETVASLFDFEDEHKRWRGMTTPPRPLFRLDSLILGFQNYQVHSSVFTAIVGLLETGVKLESLSLPNNDTMDEEFDDPQALQAWRYLASAICGCAQRPTRRPVQVVRLDVGDHFVFPHLLMGLFCGFREARTLNSVSMAYPPGDLDSGNFFWMWVAYTLLRPDSPSSVETLQLEWAVMTPAATECLRAVLEADFPLRLLWQKMTDNGSNGPSHFPEKPIVVNTGTEQRPRGHRPGRFLAAFVAPTQWEGILVHDDPSQLTVDVLLPGIGLCEMERESLPSKRQRVDDVRSASPTATIQQGPAKLRSLFLSIDERHGAAGDNATERLSADDVGQLLGVMGSGLTSLSVSNQLLDDAVLAACVNACPNLQHLRLESGTFKSMDWLASAYDHGCRIQSLTMASIKESPTFQPPFDLFLHKLLTPGPMKRTLKKLRIGHQWARIYRQSTADAMKQVLEDVLTLDYLHLYRCENPRLAPAIEWDVEKYQGQVIPAYGPPPLDIRMAVASVFKHLRERGPFSRLQLDVMALVFEYLGRSKTRVVISEPDGYYNSRFASRMR